MAEHKVEVVRETRKNGVVARVVFDNSRRLNVVNPPPDDLYVFPAPMRPMFADPLTQDPHFAPVFAWRDQIYRKHRGGQVKP